MNIKKTNKQTKMYQYKLFVKKNMKKKTMFRNRMRSILVIISISAFSSTAHSTFNIHIYAVTTQ